MEPNGGPIVAGGVLALLGGVLGQVLIWMREHAKRREDRQERAAARRIEFQRATLLALQDAASTLMAGRRRTELVWLQ